MSRKNHLSRINAPKTWPIKRKGIKWVAKPTPGPHKMAEAIPLIIVLRDILKITSTLKETKYVLKNKDVLLNQNSVADPKCSVGLFDTISIPKLNKSYRTIFTSNGKINFIEISESEAQKLPLKIKSKKTLPKGKVQLNFTNGWNRIVDKDGYKTNDVLLWDLNTQKIIKHIPFKKGIQVYIISGEHTGELATIQDLLPLRGVLKKERLASLKLKDTTCETRIEKLFATGEKSPEFKFEK